MPIPEIRFERAAASAVILAPQDTFTNPDYQGVEDVLLDSHADVRIFGKPLVKPGRRMGVVLKWGDAQTDPLVLKEQARELADKVTVVKK